MSTKLAPAAMTPTVQASGRSLVREAVMLDRMGLRVWLKSLKAAIAEDMTHEDISAATNIARSTVAALLNPANLPKSGSIPITAWESLRRFLKPINPKTGEPFTREELLDLILIYGDNEDMNVRQQLLAGALKKRLAIETRNCSEADVIRQWSEIVVFLTDQNERIQRMTDIINGEETPTRVECTRIAAILPDETGVRSSQYVLSLAGYGESEQE